MESLGHSMPTAVLVPSDKNAKLCGLWRKIVLYFSHVFCIIFTRQLVLLLFYVLLNMKYILE